VAATPGGIGCHEEPSTDTDSVPGWGSRDSGPEGRRQDGAELCAPVLALKMEVFGGDRGRPAKADALMEQHARRGARGRGRARTAGGAFHHQVGPASAKRLEPNESNETYTTSNHDALPAVANEDMQRTLGKNRPLLGVLHRRLENPDQISYLRVIINHHSLRDPLIHEHLLDHTEGDMIDLDRVLLLEQVEDAAWVQQTSRVDLDRHSPCIFCSSRWILIVVDGVHNAVRNQSATGRRSWRRKPHRGGRYSQRS